MFNSVILLCLVQPYRDRIQEKLLISIQIIAVEIAARTGERIDQSRGTVPGTA